MEDIKLQQLITAVAELKELLKTPKTVKPTRSDTLNELFSALAKAQSEMRMAGLHSENPYFKSRYADMAEIVSASRPALTKNGLCVIQQILANEDGQSILHTILCHSSGQWIETQMRVVPAKNDIQTLGSYITYLRRYAYAALVGVTTGGEDDDGEVAMVDNRKQFVKGPNTNYNPKENSFETITKEQIEELEYELNEHPDIAEMVLEKLQLQSLADMPKSKYMVSLTRIREIKQARAGVK